MDRRDSETAPVVRKPVAAAGRATNVTTGGEGGAAPAPGPGDASFDTNMVIILAALFFALLFAIGLNSLARCALRCGGRGSNGEGASASSSGGASCTRGIKKRALRSIPVEVYSGGDGGGDAEDVCAICLGEFADGEKVRVLPRCGHGFHVPCVDAWLRSRGSCPTCRRPVVVGGNKAPPKAGGGGGGEAGQSRRRQEDSDTIAVVIA